MQNAKGKVQLYSGSKESTSLRTTPLIDSSSFGTNPVDDPAF